MASGYNDYDSESSKIFDCHKLAVRGVAKHTVENREIEGKNSTIVFAMVELPK